jgi:hypothetical protein
VHEVSARKPPGPRESGPHRNLLDDEHRNSEAEGGEPEQSRDDEGEDEERDRREDEPTE